MAAAIAVAGLACRFPEGDGPAALWETVLARRRAFRPLPPQRLDLSDYRPRFEGDPDSIYPIQVAVLEGYAFDRSRYRIPGTSYAAADLTHWLALDTAQAALDDAGLSDLSTLARDRIGVIVGNTMTGEFSRASLLRLRWPYVRRLLEAELESESGLPPEYRAAFLRRIEARFKAPFPEPTEETLAGGLANTIAGRICNHFDFKGGGYTVDGACAASLLAVITGCERLSAGALDVALVGGVDLSLDPFELVGFARNGALAHGDMRVFDAASDGFWPGEGCGFVVLMRSADARARGAPVHAVIRGWGISSDGGGGLTRPTIDGQVLAIRRAADIAGLAPRDIGYVEAHGTGTAVGDPTELRAIAAAREDAGFPAYVGSIKANIGHTKAAAGIAGLIKAVCAARAGLVPPVTGCDRPHPVLAELGGRICLPRTAHPAPTDRQFVLGVSAFGFGGINSHVVLQATEEASLPRLPRSRLGRLLRSPQDTELLVLSGADREGLLARIDWLLERTATLSAAEMTDLAAKLATSPHGPARAAVVAGGTVELAARLRWLREELCTGSEVLLDPANGSFASVAEQRHPPRIAFLFPGQAAPVYREGGLWRQRFAAVAALYDGLNLPPPAEPEDTASAQPAVVTASLAALQVLARLGLRARAAVGHSLGELTALHWAGGIGQAETLRIAHARGMAMAEHGKAGGGMALVATAAAEAEALIGARPLVLACDNAEAECVVAGPAAALTALSETSRRRGIDVRRLAVSHAFHSPMVAAAAPALQPLLAAHGTVTLRRRVVSTVTAQRLPRRLDLAAHMSAQLTAPVRFREAAVLALEGADLVLEVGPGAGLSRLVRAATAAPVIPLDAGGNSLAGLLHAAGAAFVLGAPVRPAALFADRFTRSFDPNRVPQFLANPCEQAPRGRGAEDAGSEPSAAAAANGGDAGAEPFGGIHSEDPATVLRQLLAMRLALPADELSDSDRFLEDLHLSSIAVGQVVAKAALALHLKVTMPVTDFAGLNLGEATEALVRMREGESDGSAERMPAGIDSWARAFVDNLEPQPAQPTKRARVGWRLLVPAEHPDRLALRRAFADAAPAGGSICLVLAVPPGPSLGHLGWLLAAARAALSEAQAELVLVLHHGGSAGGFARSLFFELGDVSACLVELPVGVPQAPDWARAEAQCIGSGFSDICYDREGRRYVRSLAPVDLVAADPDWPVGRGDTVLVSGGAKGIGAECGLALAQVTGARLAAIGRSSRSDPEVAATLDRADRLGLCMRYYQVDITAAAATRTAIATAEAELGPATAILHAAAVNRPVALRDLDLATLDETVQVKLAGLNNLLAAVDRKRLRLLVGFGSIIAQVGLRGELHYAVANDLLAGRVQQLAPHLPACRSLVLDWTVWAGAGMGERLGSIAQLAAQGVAPLPLDQGLDWFLHLLRTPGLPVRLAVAGRLGDPPTLRFAGSALPLHRFLEWPRVHVPLTELVVDSALSLGSDPYLDEHRIDGAAVLPGVMLLEAMAQAAAALRDGGGALGFREVDFRDAIVVPDEGEMALRVAALRRPDGSVDLAVRGAATGFHFDHVRACCPAEADPPPALSPPDSDGAAGPADALYGFLFFQTGRFRRVRHFHTLTATGCDASITGDPEATCFGRFVDQTLVLGDPARRDAILHALQACIPHFTVLPVAVDRIWIRNDAPGGEVRALAASRGAVGDPLVFDIDVIDRAGALVEQWRGLRLKPTGRRTPPKRWPYLLLAPYFERMLAEIAPGADFKVRLGLDDIASKTSRPGKRPQGAPVVRRGDGKPLSCNGRAISLSRSEPFRLTLRSEHVGGCDVERVRHRAPHEWEAMLGDELFSLAEWLCPVSQGGPDDAATRVWGVWEALVKAGAPAAPVVFERAAGEGWLVFRAGRLSTLSWCGDTEAGRFAFTFALATTREGSPEAPGNLQHAG